MIVNSWWGFEVKALENEARVIRGWATTPETDRMDDIVEPKGAQFNLPFTLLRQHKPEQPIGHVIKADVTDNGIEITARLSEPGVPYIDETWELIKRRLFPGLSIGFRALEDEPIKNSYGRRFKKWEWLELSVVTIPANADASITSIKSLDRQQMRAALGNAPLPVVRLSSPRPGAAGTKPYVIRNIHT